MSVNDVQGFLNVEGTGLLAPQVGVANTNPQHTLSVGSNLYVSGDSSDVLTVDGNVVCEGVKVGLIEIVPSYDLAAVSNVGNVTANTILFTNPDTGIVATGNVSVGKTLTVDGIRITAAAEADVDLDAVVAAGPSTARSIQLTGAIDSVSPYTGALQIGTNTGNNGGLGVAGNVHVGRGLYVDTDTLVADSTTNRVGIGKTNPDATLDIDGDAIIRGDLSVLGTTTTIDTNNLRVQDPIIELGKDNTASPVVDLGLLMTRPVGSSNVGIIFDESADTLEIGYTDNDASATDITMDSTPLSVNVNGELSVTSNIEVGTANLFVDTLTGRVGIGKTDPSYQLDVQNISDDADKTMARLYSVANATGVSNTTLRLEKGTGYGGIVKGFLSQNVGSGLSLHTLNGGTDVQAMTIMNSGNVGIGTTNPDGNMHTYVSNPTEFTGITNQSADVKALLTNDGLNGTNGAMIQVYKSVTNRTPSAIDFHSEENFNASNVYTLCLNPRGGRIGLNDLNPNSDLTMGARIYNTKGYVGLVGDNSNPIVYKGDPTGTTTTLPYTQLSTSNPTNGAAYYFINPYPGEAQCTIIYDNAQSSANGLVYFYQNGPNYQPATYLSNSPSGNSEFTIPLLETGTLRGMRVNAVHIKPVNGAQIRIVAVYWVPYRGVTANIKDGGKLVLGTVGSFGTPEAGLTFRREYETPTGNQLEPSQRLDNGIAWMTDLSTWYNGALGGNGINWSKNNSTYGVSAGARIWYQPGSFISAGGGAGNCGRLNLSAGHTTAASNTPDITITSGKRVGIGTTNPFSKLSLKPTTIYNGETTSSFKNTMGGLEFIAANTDNSRWNMTVHDDNDLYFLYTTGGTSSWGISGYLSDTVNVSQIDFTGQHRNFIDGVSYANYDSLEGLIVSANKNKYYDIDENVTTGANAIQISQSLPLVALSNVALDKACFGVISGVEDPETREYAQGSFVSVVQKQVGDRRAYINSLGEGAIWVTNINGTLESGDYITTSNVAGYGMKQDSEFLANYTVAKITMDCDFNPVTQPIQIIKKKPQDVNYWVNTTYENVIEEEYSNLTEENRRIVDGIYQKITIEESKTEQEGYELEVRQELVNVLDEHGQIQWEDDPSGATEKAYKIRYLDADGNITDEANAVHKAAFVGCTYHCG